MRRTVRLLAVVAAVILPAACGKSGGPVSVDPGLPHDPSADLRSLSVSSGILAPAFDPAIGAYSLTLPHLPASITLLPLAIDPAAVITVNGIPIASGAPSSAVPVSVASPLITVTVKSGALQWSATITCLDDPLPLYMGAIQGSHSGLGPIDAFGSTIAISGDTIVVGSPWEAFDASGVNATPGSYATWQSGAAYVFVRDGTTWVQQAYLKASNARMHGTFGFSVAISGNTIVVGSPGETSVSTGVNGGQADGGALAAGAAYVFVRSGPTWSQQAYLKASNTQAGDSFGSVVAVSGDSVVVGAPGEDSGSAGINGNAADNGMGDAGAAYAFVRSGPTWTQEAYLKASNPGSTAGFGASLAISGSSLIVGAFRDSSGAPAGGAAYVFVRAAGTWAQEALLTATHPSTNGNFGGSVAIDGDTAVAAGAGDQVAGDSGAAAYVLVRSSGTWIHQGRLTAPVPDPTDAFGMVLALSGDTIAVGAYYEDGGIGGINGDLSDDSVHDSGAAFVYTRSGGTWSLDSYLKAPVPVEDDHFGKALAIGSGEILVGAPNSDGGRVHIFE